MRLASVDVPYEVEISSLDLGRFHDVLPPDRFESLSRAADEARELLRGRVVWNVNSTARGGGVAELLQPLVGYARGAGIDVRWLVIEGDSEFFTVTKRIHNRLHGTPGDGEPLDEAARRVYEAVSAENVAASIGRVRRGDVVIVHDPQPAGMIKALRDVGASVIWRCHVGVDEPNELVREAWTFLRPYVVDANVFVFSRERFAWEGLDRDRIVVIPPSIDAFAPKNVDLDPQLVDNVLQACGLLPRQRDDSAVSFQRADGTPGRIEHEAEIVEDMRLAHDTPVVVQVSRWDALKDPVGVIGGFGRHVPASMGAHLVYAGPAVNAVADDPEGLQTLHRAVAERDGLPREVRRRVHLVSLPMDDLEENAIMVNALQRHATVITQKSLAEGFGLTVAEAMWKGRPVVASRVGGIQEQVVHGETGLLLDDPRDLHAFGAAVSVLLGDADKATEMGRRARERVREHFLSARTLLDYLAVIRRVLHEVDEAGHARAGRDSAAGATVGA
jgi:trehalose synthase